MGSSFPVATLKNLLSLPARHLAVVHPDGPHTAILVARVVFGRPRPVDFLVIDAAAEGLASPAEIKEDLRARLAEIGPEALVLVIPQHRLLRHVLDVPPGDAAEIRAQVEREASHIGGLSESTWAFDSARLLPFGGHAHPLAAVYCRQSDLAEALEAYSDDEDSVFEVIPAGDALAAAYLRTAPARSDAILIDLGIEHTGLTIVHAGQAVFSSSFPSGSAALRVAPSDDPAPAGPIRAWLVELERTIHEWTEDHPKLAGAAQQWPAYLAGIGSDDPTLPEALCRAGTRPFASWSVVARTKTAPHSEGATAWGALLAALGQSTPVPSLLPRPRRDFWAQQRFWRGLLSANFLLAAILAWVLGMAIHRQQQQLDAKARWQAAASRALEDARDIRVVAEGLNGRLDALRPVLERQRQTVETLQTLSALQLQRTNAEHWYVLLADNVSYAAGSNHFVALPPLRGPDHRHGPGSAASTNAAGSPDRTFVAEVCVLPQGEKMRQKLSDLVADLKRIRLFANVDVLPPERRRPWVATNLYFPERHFALELNLSEDDLLPPLPLVQPATTNREPRAPFRTALRPAPADTRTTNANGNAAEAGNRNGRSR